MNKQLTKKQEREQLMISLKEAINRVEKAKEEYRTLYKNYRDGQPMGKVWESSFKLKNARVYKKFILNEVETFNKSLKINNK
jgi:hypothetical protein